MEYWLIGVVVVLALVLGYAFLLAVGVLLSIGSVLVQMGQSGHSDATDQVKREAARMRASARVIEFPTGANRRKRRRQQARSGRR